ncbi:MAG: M56 and DUF3738 domain-containing protein [Bryobacteraceae bacterium]
MNAELLFAANHLWQSTLCAAAAGLLALALRKNRARAQHWVWMIASIKFLILLWLFTRIGSHLGWLKASAAPAARLSSAVKHFSQPFLALPISAALPAGAADPLPYILLAVWLSGCIAVLFSWWRRWRIVAAAVRAASPLPLEIGVRVMASPALLEPGVFGIFHPVLLLPRGIEDRLTPEQLQAILAHELCHIRRRDNLAAAVHLAVEAVCWFHPLAWWIGARLVEERERACDEEVLRAGNQPRTYAESILLTCKFYLESPIACVSGVTGADLKRRLAGIMTQPVALDLSLGRKLLLAAAGAAAIGAPIGIGLVGAPRIQAQSPAAAVAPPEFEVASVKPSAPGTRGFIGAAPGGERFTATKATLKWLIMMAYDITDRQISGGPNWLDADTYDVYAKAERPSSREQIYLMLQTLLADRFKLSLHRETRELPVYALVADKGVPKLKLHESPDSVQPLIKGYAGGIAFQNVPLSRLAWFLSTQADRTVLDQTGIKGSYDFNLEWTLDAPAKGHSLDSSSERDPFSASILTAVREQLGLKVESQRGPVLFLSVEHVEKPSEN